MSKKKDKNYAKKIFDFLIGFSISVSTIGIGIIFFLLTFILSLQEYYGLASFTYNLAYFFIFLFVITWISGVIVLFSKKKENKNEN